jgi:uncharacterized protein involved in response to NO
MVFGFIVAAAAGFLLTAVPVWTASTPVQGVRLGLLCCAWLAGRAAMLAAHVLPAWLVALCDLSMVAALLVALTPPLLRAQQRRNRGFIAILLVLLAGNASFHLDALGFAPGAATLAVRLAIDGVLLLVVLIGGRIIPTFTANALRRRGSTAEVRSRPWLDRASIAGVACVVLADVIQPSSGSSATARLVCGLALLLWQAGWQPMRVASDALLWSLHAGFVCVSLGLLLGALQEYGLTISPMVALHTITIGSFGTLILSVMSRVSLGHTGRELLAPSGFPLACGSVLAAAALRVLGALSPAHALEANLAAAALFASAFAFFLLVLGPILLAPRSDGLLG